MPSYSWSFSGSLSFSDLVTVYCVFDSDVQGLVQSVSATFDATSPVNTTTFGIYAHYYGAGDTPPITGTGYFVPAVNPDPDGRCFETPSYGSGHWLGAGGACADPSPAHQRVQVYVYPRGGGGSSFPKTFDIALSGGWTGDLSGGYCSYGYRLKPAQQYVAVISAASIGAMILLVPEAALLGIVFETLIGFSWVPGTVCGGPAPPLPTWSPDDFIMGTGIPSPSGLPKTLQAWEAINWPLYCECVPATGTDPPAVAPPPVFVPPTQPYVPVQPLPVVCDNTSLCDMLNQLSRQLNAVQQQIGWLRGDVTLIQRQGVPFGYQFGTVHSALSGNGAWTIADLLGLAVTFSSIPAGHVTGSTDPPTYHQLGKISLGTVDGWRRSWQPTHSPYLILPITGAFTRLGYTFSDGVVATITELIREP
jgi:hypothetical protein